MSGPIERERKSEKGVINNTYERYVIFYSLKTFE